MVKILTDRFVMGAGADTSERYFDTHTRGLVLRTGKRRKVWYFQYRFNGAVCWLRLGEYPAIALADARKLVTAHRAVLDTGHDPAVVREQAIIAATPAPIPKAYTFADFVPVYVQFQKGRTKGWEDEAAKIERHLLPAWKSLPLADIKRKQVHELLDSLAAKGLTTGVNRIQALVSRIFTIALSRGHVEAHPVARMVKNFPENARDRVLTDVELRALCTGLDAQPGAAADAMRLRVLLGQRGGETAGMLWKELDLEAGVWTMPPPRTKNKKPHSVPLSPTALELITKRRAVVPEDEPRVFPALTLVDYDSRALAVIHGGAYEWKDLRRTVATRLAELGFDETTIGRVLNHARHTITGKHYNVHTYDVEKRQALEAWDRELTRILKGEPKTRKVLPMRRR